jgi:hypothetical protein
MILSSLLSGLQEAVISLGKISVILLPAMLSIKITNQLIKKIYPSFNPKMRWEKSGSWLQAIPSTVMGCVTAFYLGSYMRNYVVATNLDLIVMVAAIALLVYLLFIKKVSLK